jgi:hypothetical protein
LTNIDGENTLPSKWKTWLPIGLFVLAVAGAVLFFLLKQPGTEKPHTYGEDELPAIKIVVTNGCGYEQLASEFANALKNINVEVVSLGDTSKPIYDKSIIVIRKGDMQDLKRLQKMTGIERWTSAYNEYFNADFEIIVGRDYEQYISR